MKSQKQVSFYKFVLSFAALKNILQAFVVSLSCAFAFRTKTNICFAIHARLNIGTRLIYLNFRLIYKIYSTNGCMVLILKEEEHQERIK